MYAFIFQLAIKYRTRDFFCCRFCSCTHHTLILRQRNVDRKRNNEKKGARKNKMKIVFTVTTASATKHPNEHDEAKSDRIKQKKNASKKKYLTKNWIMSENKNFDGLLNLLCIHHSVDLMLELFFRRISNFILSAFSVTWVNYFLHVFWFVALLLMDENSFCFKFLFLLLLLGVILFLFSFLSREIFALGLQFSCFFVIFNFH